MAPWPSSRLALHFDPWLLGLPLCLPLVFSGFLLTSLPALEPATQQALQTLGLPLPLPLPLCLPFGFFV